MEIKNCRKCKRLFNYIAGPQICPTCREELEKKFQEVKVYLQENKNANIKDVVENCDVAESQIRQWIKEERLEFASGMNLGITCEICGASISTGKYCEKCKTSMVNKFTALNKQMTPQEIQISKTDHSNKMRFVKK